MTRGLRDYLSEANRHKTSQMEEPQEERQKRLLRFDYPGAVTLAIWITSFLVIIDLQVQLSWTSPLLLSLIIIGITSFLIFLVLETYSGGRELLIPLSLLKTDVGAFCAGQVSDTSLQSLLRCKRFPRNTFAAILRINANSMFNFSYFWSAVVKGYGVMSPYRSCFTNVILQFVAQIVPYFLNTRGSSDTEAGWLIVPVSLGNAVGSLVAGRMIKR